MVKSAMHQLTQNKSRDFTFVKLHRRISTISHLVGKYTIAIHNKTRTNCWCTKKKILPHFLSDRVNFLRWLWPHGEILLTSDVFYSPQDESVIMERAFSDSNTIEEVMNEQKNFLINLDIVFRVGFFWVQRYTDVLNIWGQ